MILVFDLDDTLYQELFYVKSGFRAVAKFMARQLGLAEQTIYKKLLKYLKLGRGKIFDNTLKEFDCCTKSLVKKCLAVYRSHKPRIVLAKEAKKCLARFRRWPLYIVTDGNKIVQNNKIKALGLAKQVKKVFITRRYGIKNEKPSPHCFLKISQLEKTGPENIVYIADDPTKDFIALKPLGFKTVRVLKGNHKNKKLPRAFEAQLKINSLDALTNELLSKL